jgi:ATP-dependent RNA helicase DDX23/PRP28
MHFTRAIIWMPSDNVIPKFIPKNQRTHSPEIQKINTQTESPVIHAGGKRDYPPLKPNYPEYKKKRSNKISFDWDARDDTTSLAADMNFLPVLYPSGNCLKHNLGESLHWKCKSLSEMTDRDWRIFREDFGIVVSCPNPTIPKPIRFWKECSDWIPYLLLRTITTKYIDPTPIQRQAIPVAISGVDLLGLAETGSGKTLSFLVPLFCHILKKRSVRYQHSGPMGIIIAPTRELVLQIEQAAKRLSQDLNFIIVSLIGGHSLAEQSISLNNGSDIIIATPGRLRDCIEQKVFPLSDCAHLVFDEADRIIDMNFEDDLNFIIASINKYSPIRQVMLFSATMHPLVEKIAQNHLKSPFVTIRIGEVGAAAVDTVSQKLEWIENEQEKASRLLCVIGSSTDFCGEGMKRSSFKPPIIVFVNQKHRVDFVSKRLECFGWKVAQLHGDKSQVQREAAISSIKSGFNQILVATDVAGRGIDIPNVSLVLNYDMAKSVNEYLHRIGRTGRAGSSGTAVTFITSDDAHVFFELRLLIERSKN